MGIVRPEIWGGVECTINRRQNVFRDQLDYARHYERQGANFYAIQFRRVFQQKSTVELIHQYEQKLQ